MVEKEEELIKIKRSCSLNDVKEISKLVKSSSFENSNTEELEVNLIESSEIADESVKSVKTFQDVDLQKINEIMSNPQKCKLMQTALDLGLNIKEIFECLLEDSYLNEEKFFEKLIESAVKSNDGQKGTNNNNNNLIETLTIQEGDENENSEETEFTQLGDEKQKIITKLNSNLRPIIIDGLDVAKNSNNQTFSVTKIKSVVEYFEDRGHSVIVIVPEKDVQENQYLTDLEKFKHQVCSPRSKQLFDKRIDCDVDALILSLANKKDGDFQGGIIVSNNDFKKNLLNDDGDKYKQIIEERVLMYSFFHDEFIPAPDPLGKNGPCLDNFLLFETVINQKHCPYKKKCTYGTKCKFFHPERESKKQFKTAFESVNDEVKENRRVFENLKKIFHDLNSSIQLQQRSISKKDSNPVSKIVFKEQNANELFIDSTKPQPSDRNDSYVQNQNQHLAIEKNMVLYEKLLSRLPEHKALKVMNLYPDETDEDKLVYFAKEEEDF